MVAAKANVMLLWIKDFQMSGVAEMPNWPPNFLSAENSTGGVG